MNWRNTVNKAIIITMSFFHTTVDLLLPNPYIAEFCYIAYKASESSKSISIKNLPSSQ